MGWGGEGKEGGPLGFADSVVGISKGKKMALTGPDQPWGGGGEGEKTKGEKGGTLTFLTKGANEAFLRT